MDKKKRKKIKLSLDYGWVLKTMNFNCKKIPKIRNGNNCMILNSKQAMI